MNNKTVDFIICCCLLCLSFACVGLVSVIAFALYKLFGGF